MLLLAAAVWFRVELDDLRSNAEQFAMSDFLVYEYALVGDVIAELANDAR
jgi:hypothetical protein